MFPYVYIVGFCGVVINVLDGDIIVSEFNLQSRYVIHFWANTLDKVVNILIPPHTSYILNSSSIIHHSLALTNPRKMIYH